jgi:ARG and Rhodanese-Phosphatase-superfamily-associated Protein domain
MKSLLVLAVVLLISLPISAADPPPAGTPTVKQVSGPFTSGNLTVFLIHGPDAVPGLNVLTLQEAIEQKKVKVHETSEVNNLSVENTGELPVFLQTGDILRGGKQDRVIAMDLIVPKGARVGIASFCVEAGRWRQRGLESAAEFNKSMNQVVGKDQKLAVNDSKQQSEVWKEVANTQAKLAKNVGAPVADPASPSSLQLTLENAKVKEKLTAYEKDLSEALKGKTDVIGVALAINGEVQGAEVYGSAALCAKLWPKLLNSAATDALAQLDPKKKFDPATPKAVESFLTDAMKGTAKEVEPSAVALRGQQRGESQPPAPSAPGTPMTPPGVRIVRYDTAKSLVVECRDPAKPAMIIHQSYIGK